MNDTQMMEVIYNILAQNEVDPLARDEVLRRIDFVDYDNMNIAFDNTDDKTRFTLQVVRQ